MHPQPGKKGLGCMNLEQQDHVVPEYRAAILLGIAPTDIRRYSRIAGVGHWETGDRGEQVFFTYEELRTLCLIAAQSSK